MKLIDYISTTYNISKKKSKKIIDSRHVFVNNKRIWIASYEVSYNDNIEVFFNTNNNKIYISILYEDDHLLVVDKPAGIKTTEKNSIEEYIKKKYSKKYKVCHRLDKETSGSLIFAKNNDTFYAMKQIFKEHKIKKIYNAIIAGHFPFKEKIIKNNIDNKKAETKIKLLKANNIISLLEIEIITGRTHQIRKHLKEIDFFLLGEKKYNSKLIRRKEFKAINRQMLHSKKIIFTHPFLNKKIIVESPLPDDFKEILEKFLN